MRKSVVAVALTVLATSAVALQGAPAGGSPAAPEVEPAAARPNIVFILMDDMRRDDVAWMPTVEAEIARTGTAFSNYYSPTALCCPSRASTLRGQYPHNTGVLTNAEPDGGFAGFGRLDGSTLATWLDPTYATGYVGKYLNGYSGRSQTYVPPGWDDWNGTVNTYNYLGIHTNDNGTIRDESGVNSPQVFARQSSEFIAERSPRAEPFFLHLSFVTPHGGSPHGDGDDGAKSAYVPRRDRGTYDGPAHPPGPAYDEADVRDKTGPVADLPPLDFVDERSIALRNEQRRESLASADRAVARVLAALKATGEHDNTYVVFASDNGYTLGEHRMPNGKSLPYEPASHLPLFVTGPDVPAGGTWTGPAGTQDLAPTMLDMAGADAGIELDGHSVLPTLARPDGDPGRAVLLEGAKLPTDAENGGSVAYAERRAVGQTEWVYRGVVTKRWKFVRWDQLGTFELYDLARDPQEVENLGATRKYADRVAAMRARLRDQWLCEGRACD